MRVISFASIILMLPSVLAHEEASKTTLLNGFTLQGIFIFSVLLLTLLIAIVIAKRTAHRYKKILFTIIVALTLIPTLFLLGSIIYTNTISITKGPVHWHADFEVWNCGEKLDIINPEGLLNRVGTPLLHEHGDNRIHVEGVLLDKSEADLHTFFDAIGGDLTKTIANIPTNKETQELINDRICNSKEGRLQVFVYKIINPKEKNNWQYEQQKIEDFQNYVLSPQTNIPPGDCIIIEFDQEKNKTDKLCSSYASAIQQGKILEANQ